MAPFFALSVASQPTQALASSSPARTVAGALVEEFARAGIRDILYVPGGPMMPFVSTAFATGWFRFVLCRHEQGAGFIAEGLARVQRRPALVLVTAGPGVTNLVTPVYVAYSEMTPVFVLSAQVSRHMNGRGAAQECNTVELLRPITKHSVALGEVHGTRETVRNLLAATTAGKAGPVHLSVASDQWLQEVSHATTDLGAFQRANVPSSVWPSSQPSSQPLSQSLSRSLPNLTDEYLKEEVL